MKLANLALRFLLELIALGALGYWGVTSAGPVTARVALGAAAPMLAAAFWGAFVAPRARVALPTAARMALGLAVFGVAAVALAARGHGWLAEGFLTLAVANVALMLVWRQDRLIPHGAL